MQGTSIVFSRRLLKWYDTHQRSLPWRPNSGASPAAIDPYHSLVSEAMLQQTRVATVVPYFQRFIARYPTVRALAESDLQEVLRLWQGLGYYSRAKNLRAAARKIVDEFGGSVPETVEELLSLPGVGRYTAGAICSIAFDRPAAILDGNVARVLCRLDCIVEDPRDPAVREILWTRAHDILPKKRLGDFNSALMELGALVCTPRSPQCLLCPVKLHCKALAARMQDQIPLPKKTKPIPLHRRYTFCIRRKQHYLIEQRPARGRWAGMWQFITLQEEPKNISGLRKIGQIEHSLSHRRYEFEVFACGTKDLPPALVGARKWVTLDELGKFPLPQPHLRIAKLLSAGGTPP
jgi:A/G-specific adenine glycosylase